MPSTRARALTAAELHAVTSLLAAVINDNDGLHSYGLSSREEAALRRGLGKLIAQERAARLPERPSTSA